jgi:hypothetical protein
MEMEAFGSEKGSVRVQHEPSIVCLRGAQRRMKRNLNLILVTSIAAVLGLGLSGTSEAHGYPSTAGGSVYWADDNVFIGLNYGGPYVQPYYAPPRYVYRPRAYRHAYRHDKHYGYSKSYRKGHRHGHGRDNYGRRDYDRRGHDRRHGDH